MQELILELELDEEDFIEEEPITVPNPQFEEITAPYNISELKMVFERLEQLSQESD
jgi:hypothetical protein